jgi:hypothetical protein
MVSCCGLAVRQLNRPAGEGNGFEPLVSGANTFATTLIELRPLLLRGKQLSSPEGLSVRLSFAHRGVRKLSARR